jgi:hypothetical protein
VPAPMQTLTLSTHYSIVRKTFAPRHAALLGGGVQQVRRRQPRPSYGFTIHNSHAVKSEMDTFFGFFTYHQGDMPFYYDGGPYGTISTPALFGFGDSVRTEFFLPNRLITAATLLTYTSAVLDSPQPSVDLTQGLVTYSSPPALNAPLTATYSCTYKCVFDIGDELLMSEENFYSGLFKVEGIQLREAVP